MRPYKPTRSNYYRSIYYLILLNNENIADHIVEQYGEKVRREFIFYCTTKIKPSKTTERNTEEIDLNQIKPYVDISLGFFFKRFSIIQSYLMDDENGVKKIRMMMYLLDTYANTFHNILESEKSDIINKYDITDEQLDHILHDIEGYFKEKYRDLEFYNKVYFDLIAGQEEPELDFELSPPSAILEKDRSLAPKISEDMYVLCEKLISGYKIYLEKLEIGIPNKRKICRDIELNHFNNAIVNIRQDYHDYDSYFGGNYDGKSYSEIFSIETKTKLLYNALNFFLREPTKSA